MRCPAPEPGRPNQRSATLPASLQTTRQRARAFHQHGAVSEIGALMPSVRSSPRNKPCWTNYARQVNEIKLFTALGGG